MKSKELKVKNVDNRLKTTSGITLITLVITIILLIILAGVVINVTIGKDGIISKAKNAKEKYEIAEIREKIEIEILNIELEEDNLGNEVTIELVLQKLVDNKIFETIDKDGEIGYIGSYEVKLKYNENNKVVIEYIKKVTGVRITYSLEPSTYTKEERVHILLKVQGKVKSITSPDGVIIYPKQDTETVDYSVTSNGSYTFIIENENSKKEEKNVIVDIIDRLEPKAFEIAAQTTRTGGIKITANAEDEEADEGNVKSGIGRYEYYIKLSTASEYTKYDTNEIISLPSGTYKVYAVAYDKAENSIRSTNEVEVVVEEWVQIWNEGDLRNMANNLSKNYIIMQDIELTQNWTRIGDSRNPFRGKLEGNNHKIIGLVIDSEEEDQGLFGVTYDGKISNLNIIDCNIKGKDNVGALIGLTHYTTQGKGTVIDNVKVTGTITGNNNVGGIIGRSIAGNITGSISNVNVSGNDGIGGLAGDIDNGSTINKAIVKNSYSVGEVSGKNNVGGLIGGNSGGVVTNVYSTSKVTAIGSKTGGLIGYSTYGNVKAEVKNAYSTGEVIGERHVGGLIGYAVDTNITNTYSISKLTGKYSIGGLIGELYRGNIKTSYWTKEKSEVTTNTGGTCLTLEEMQNKESYESWDFDSGTVWIMKEFPELILNIEI